MRKIVNNRKCIHVYVGFKNPLSMRNRTLRELYGSRKDTVSHKGESCTVQHKDVHFLSLTYFKLFVSKF